MQQHHDSRMAATAEHSEGSLDLAEAEALCASLKRISVRSEKALSEGDACLGIAQVERWVESYRRGLAAAEKISCSGIDMLQKTRDQLALALEERLRLDDEGATPPTAEQTAHTDELASALRRIDRLLPVLEQAFHGDEPATPEEAA